MTHCVCTGAKEGVIACHGVEKQLSVIIGAVPAFWIFLSLQGRGRRDAAYIAMFQSVTFGWKRLCVLLLLLEANDQAGNFPHAIMRSPALPSPSPSPSPE